MINSLYDISPMIIFDVVLTDLGVDQSGVHLFMSQDRLHFLQFHSMLQCVCRCGVPDQVRVYSSPDFRPLSDVSHDLLNPRLFDPPVWIPVTDN